MVIFNQLRISDDGKSLYVNAHVNKASYFDNVYIKSITIMIAEKVSETDPEVPTKDYIYQYEVEEKQKELNMVFTSTDFLKYWETDPNAMKFNQSDMSKTLFFVYIQVTDGADSTTPCSLDTEYTLGVTFDENILYQRIMDYTKELANRCAVPLGYVDFILLWYAFKAAVETEHYVAAIKFYNMLFGVVSDTGNTSVIKSCGCNG